LFGVVLTVEYYSVIKKEWNPDIYNNMDGREGHDVKWMKPGAERQVPHVLTHMFNLQKCIS
jgi:hypothetical protein